MPKALELRLKLLKVLKLNPKSIQEKVKIFKKGQKGQKYSKYLSLKKHFVTKNTQKCSKHQKIKNIGRVLGCNILSFFIHLDCVQSRLPNTRKKQSVNIYSTKKRTGPVGLRSLSHSSSPTMTEQWQRLSI